MFPSPTYKYKLDKYSVYSGPVYQVGMFTYREKIIHILYHTYFSLYFHLFYPSFFEINPENEQITDIFK